MVDLKVLMLARSKVHEMAVQLVDHSVDLKVFETVVHSAETVAGEMGD